MSSLEKIGIKERYNPSLRGRVPGEKILSRDTQKSVREDNSKDQGPSWDDKRKGDCFGQGGYQHTLLLGAREVVRWEV